MVAFEAVAPSGAWCSNGALPLNATTYRGNYDEVAPALNALPETPGALVLLFTHGQGMEAFLDALQPKFAGVPTVGGAAARADVGGRGAVSPACRDVTALLLNEPGWVAETVLFHRPTGIRFVANGSEPRAIPTVLADGETVDARAFIESSAKAMGITEAPLDRVALIAEQGQLFHMSPGSSGINVSANLPASRELELAVFDDDYGQAGMAQAVTPGSIVFGCAGLHGLISGRRPWEQSPAAYMYGEVVTLGDRAYFANLSMSILSPTVSR